MEGIKELIKVTPNDKGINCLSARELHEGLEVDTQFTKWMERMFKYGFVENEDYIAVSQKRLTAQGNTTTYKDYIITIDMAKELCMIQRTPLGRQFRQYFIQCERELVNSKPMLTPQQQCILDIYEGGVKAVESAKQLIELEVEPHRHGEDERWTATKLVEELRSSVKVLDDFRLTTTDLHKWFIFNGYGSWKVIDTKGAVSKKGYFKPNDKFINENC